MKYNTKTKKAKKIVFLKQQLLTRIYIFLIYFFMLCLFYLLYYLLL